MRTGTRIRAGAGTPLRALVRRAASAGLVVLTVGVVAGSTVGNAAAASLAPVVSTGQAEGVAQNSVTLTAGIETQGVETTFEFDLGADTSYGSRIFGDAGYELGPQTYRASLQGLAPGTTYHYRVAATNVYGTVYGADVTFTTGTYPSSVLAVPVTLPSLPAILLAPEPSTSTTGKASAASVSAAARRAASAAGHRKRARKSTRPRKSGPRGAGSADGANRGGGR